MGAANDWFFVRYGDPDPHLRIRFRGQSERLMGELLPRICTWAHGLITNGLSTRLCFDTYDRELERYGGPEGTAAAEAILGADSRAVIEMLRISRGGLLELDMTSLTVLSIDDFLTGLGASDRTRRLVPATDEYADGRQRRVSSPQGSPAASIGRSGAH